MTGYTRQDEEHLLETWLVIFAQFSSRRPLRQLRMESRGNRDDNRITEGTESELANVDAVYPSYRGCVFMRAG